MAEQPVIKPDRTRWVTAAALSALAGKGITAEGADFTAGDMAAWTAGALSPDQRVNATTRLCALGFVTHQVLVIAGHRTDAYTLTAEGAEAVRAAAAGHVRKSGPKGSRAPNPHKPTDLASRLWYLLRLRKQIDPDAAARVLCTAGEAEFARVRSTVAKTLWRWEQTGAVQAGARRVRTGNDPKGSTGFKRYVLVVDSPNPPRWTNAMRKAKAERAAAAQATQGAQP